MAMTGGQKLQFAAACLAMALLVSPVSVCAQITLTPAQKAIVDKALAGDAQAQSEVGMLYYKGTALPKLHTQAVSWFRLSAEQGNRDGEYNLGLMYLNGAGVAQDNQQALKWLNASAIKGEGEAQLLLGLINSTGLDGGADNLPLSVAWLEMAAQQGDERATDFLSIMTPELSEETLKSASEVKQSLHAAVEAALASGQSPLGSAAKDMSAPK